MKENILTIPINDIFSPKTDCPLCLLRDILEKQSIEFMLSDAMMEPNVRIATNEMGFCTTHYQMLQQKNNRLSLALILSTHLEHIKNNIKKGDRLLSGKKKSMKEISKINESCYICSRIDAQTELMMITVLEMYTKDENFRKLFKEQKKLCLPHYELLTQFAQGRLSKKYINEFMNDCNNLVYKELDTLIDDTVHFTKMFDYRNNGKNADWGNSKDAIERSIKFLTSR